MVGSFTTAERGARGRGLRLFGRRPDGGWRAEALVEGLVNPSYVHADPERPVVYVAHGDRATVSSFEVDLDEGSLVPLGSADSGGTNGVRLTLDASGRFLFVAHFTSGTVATVPVDDTGRVGGASHRLDLRAVADSPRASQAHPHDTVIDPSGRLLVVPDRGLDRVFVLEPDRRDGRLSLVSQVDLAQGSGPRHVVFHPSRPVAYVVTETDSTVVTLDWDEAAGVLMPKHVSPALPPDFRGASTAAEIVLDATGRFLYVSNRGADNIACFSIDEGGDEPKLIQWVSSGGHVPRHMAMSGGGAELVVANEGSDSVVAFSIDPVDGSLVETSRISTQSPSAVAFVGRGAPD